VDKRKQRLLFTCSCRHNQGKHIKSLEDEESN
jgi:hypothetical protein